MCPFYTSTNLINDPLYRSERTKFPNFFQLSYCGRIFSSLNLVNHALCGDDGVKWKFNNTPHPALYSTLYLRDYVAQLSGLKVSVMKQHLV